MTHAAIVSVLVPFACAALMLLVGDRHLRVQRALGLASCVTLVVIAITAILRTSSGAVEVYRLGDWPAPFGIVLVLDRLAAFMLALTAIVAGAALAAALTADPVWDTRGRHFHPLFQLQLMGLDGAFVTGDLFNLFVFFEVLLVASYCLLVHGRGAGRLRSGFHYVAVNLAASSLFLIGIALLYAATGTLNFADLAVRVPRVAAADAGLLHVAALVLLVVFAVKAAVFPLCLWLPRAYAAAAPPVAALFAIMTKVGVYAILRLQGSVFDAGAVGPWLLVGAIATAAFGALGALAAPTLAGMTGYLTLASIGTLLIAVGAGSSAGSSAALYYLAHSTLVTAALFLLADRIAAQRGGDGFRPSPPVDQPAVLGTLFLIGAASVAGLPPLSGFIGKLAILQATATTPSRPWLWSMLLATGLLTMIGLARGGSALFWKTADAIAPAARGGLPPLAPTVGLLALGAALALLAAPVQRFADAAAAQLAEPRLYASSVLRATDEPTARPLPLEPRP
ncbi:MAG TPA: monovalent cation/H+ antiporter subunit D [Verrucomicrobiae bacterium]|jgi:multicomponent K+:H+ antiporter subunit D|nr:monovalent cation/H+ antiporter subunit D [Verrucomicrobiae bacterium]